MSQSVEEINTGIGGEKESDTEQVVTCPRAEPPTGAGGAGVESLRKTVPRS